METLPQEIVVDIFSRLPLSSVIRLRCLSKQWLSTLREDYFGGLHAERSQESVVFFKVQLFGVEGTHGKPVISMSCLQAASKTHPVHNFVRLNGGPWHRHVWTLHIRYIPSATCNGLMFIAPYAGGETRHIFVCNPQTAEYIAFPPCTADDGFFICSVGFGYSPISKQYKVACIALVKGYRTPGPGEMRVHTLGADAGWRKVPVDVDFEPQKWMPGAEICVDGKMYWVISEPHFPYDASRLLSFDVETEEVKKTDIDIPSLRSKCIFDNDFPLVPLGTGQVSMFICCDGPRRIEEWVMLSHRRWRLRRSFDLRPHCGPKDDLGQMLAISKLAGDGDMLIVFEEMTVHIHNDHIASSSFGYLALQNDCLDWSVCGGYTPSLFSLASFGRGYEIQKGGRCVHWDNNLLPPPGIGLLRLMEQPHSAGPIETSDDETGDDDYGWLAEASDDEEEPMPFDHH